MRRYQDLVECKSVVPDCNVDFVKKKIDLIRGNFRIEHKKINDSKRSGAGTDSVHVPTLWYYKLLLFVIRRKFASRSRQRQILMQTIHNRLIKTKDHADGDELKEY
uniref:MADF domain-containing protein n=1 Tax=Graphocephala atropunctata TaxID=36148 RepID=A0A1B6KBA0_9HEMI